MVEVDPRLFVTCRLCLDVQGHFQIDPNVQQQIKYCFDIDVEPFDRLPQLICKKCENILREYHAVKKNFTNKQEELKTKLQENLHVKLSSLQTSEEDKSDGSNNTRDDTGRRTKKKNKKKRIIKRVLSSSDDDDAADAKNSFPLRIKSKEERNECNYSCISLEENYNKLYVCRICSQNFNSEECITKHVREHRNLQKQYKNVFKMSCFVVMEKWDNKPNLCNSNKAVVYNTDYIVQNNHNPFYNVVYHSKTASENNKSCKQTLKRNSSDRGSTDGELLPRKCRRLSRSSSETVVINRDGEHDDTSQSALSVGGDKTPTVIDCIDIGDSSDNESYENNGINSNSNRIKGLQDSRYTQHVINVCLNRYYRLLDSVNHKIGKNTTINEEFLQHKVLSIGRKIINNKGFNCVGLLRFLEYKGLSVIWKESIISMAGNDAKYAHIATALRRNESTNISDAKWEQLLKPFKVENVDISANMLKKLNTLRHFKKPIPRSAIVSNKQQNFNSIELLPRIEMVYSESDLEITKTEADNGYLKKLLNKNPVSNPKQLPKKVNTNELFVKNMRVFSGPNSVPPKSAVVEKDDEITSNTMATVTSTASVAAIPNGEKNNIGKSEDTVKSLDNSKKPKAPWLRVKPVSELMPDKPIPLNATETYTNGEAQNALNISSVMLWPTQNPSQQQIWPNQNTQIHSENSQNRQQQYQLELSEIIPLSIQSNDTVSISNMSPRSRTKCVKPDYILLHTVEFPNTKTFSPYNYLKNLLLSHNLILLDTGESLAGAISLCKLKIHFQQQTCETIVLILSLYCLKNQFYIEIINLNSLDLKIDDLNAEWQWQLLNTFKNEDVITRCLRVAGKLSTETYQHAKDFFSLVKSIKLIE